MRLYLGGHLNFYNRGKGNWIEVKLRQPSRLSDIIDRQAIPIGEIQLVVLNGEMVDLDAMVSDPDEVKLYSAVGGG